MLTHRTNVLFTSSDYQMLSLLAQKKKTTMADLIRKAVKKNYLKKDTSRQQLVKDIKSGWGLLKHPEIPIDYKQLINDGRRF